MLGLDKYTQSSSNNHRQFSKTDSKWQLIQNDTEYTEIEKIGFVDAYTAVGWGAISFSILLMLLSPLLVKMMHGIK